MPGNRQIEELRDLIENKRKDVEWWESEVERYRTRIKQTTSSDLLHQLELRIAAKANAVAEIQVLESELKKLEYAGVIEADAEGKEKERQRQAMERGEVEIGASSTSLRSTVANGSMATRIAQRRQNRSVTRVPSKDGGRNTKKYRRRNKRKTKHYKKKTKRYTKKRNMRY